MITVVFTHFSLLASKTGGNITSGFSELPSFREIVVVIREELHLKNFADFHYRTSDLLKRVAAFWSNQHSCIHLLEKRPLTD